MTTLLVLTFGTVTAVGAFVWALCRTAADADRRAQQCRCAWCGEPTRDRLLFCADGACQLLWETAP